MKHSQHASARESKPKSRAGRGPVPNAAAEHDGGIEVQIREAAYFRYLARGAVLGHELEDWLEAETQLLDAGKSNDVRH